MEQNRAQVDPVTSVHFVENGAELTALEVRRSGRSPVIARLHRTLFALGVVVASYQLRALETGTMERIVIQRRDGGGVRGELSVLTRAAVLPIALSDSEE